MKMKIGFLLGILFIIFVSFSLVSFPAFAAKPSQRIVVGAKLKEYKPPKKPNCDIIVPKQYATIQDAIDSANNGDTVCVGKGIYNEDVMINKSIRLSGKGVSKSSINGQDPNAQGAVTITADNVMLEGFLITGVGANHAQVAVAINGSDSGPVSGAIIQYNRVVAGNGGIALRGVRDQNSIIQNNILEGNNSPYVAQADIATFLNNTFIGIVNPNDRSDTGITLVIEIHGLIQRNVFNTSGNQIWLIAANIDSLINENNFNSNTPIRKLHGGWGPLVMNAENNWWGDTDPSDNVQGEVDFTPFATSPFAEN